MFNINNYYILSEKIFMYNNTQNFLHLFIFKNEKTNKQKNITLIMTF